MSKGVREVLKHKQLHMSKGIRQVLRDRQLFSMPKGVQDALLPAVQGGRRWPFIAVLLSVFFLGISPWVYYRIVPKDYDYEVPNLPLATPVEMMFNPFGHNHSFERALEILNCTNQGWTKGHSVDLAIAEVATSPRQCPSYFHLIQKDLAPWKEQGITRANIEHAKPHAALRVVILGGNLYIDRHEFCFGNRALFTVWGLLLFLERYKSQVPDVEFMFNCEDRSRIAKTVRHRRPPLLFSYSSNSGHFDIPFPDWTFWGWSELMIGSWEEERAKIIRNSAKMDWYSKAPKPYWSGNPRVGDSHRPQLLRCNEAGITDIQVQDWKKELPNGKQNSKLEDRCTHKYMIYVEGVSWSVSLKYIMSCGSPTLVISPDNYDFYSRGLQEWVHYIPVRPQDFGDELCNLIEEKVRNGEANVTEVINIGKAGQNFLQNEVDMKNVYDYMFHLLREYSKLQQFRPSVAGGVHLVTLDQVLCNPPSSERLALEEALRLMPTISSPCYMADVPPEGFKASEWEAKAR